MLDTILYELSKVAWVFNIFRNNIIIKFYNVFSY